jgi:hypothetical protein
MLACKYQVILYHMMMSDGDDSRRRLVFIYSTGRFCIFLNSNLPTWMFLEYAMNGRVQRHAPDHRESSAPSFFPGLNCSTSTSRHLAGPVQRSMLKAYLDAVFSQSFSRHSATKRNGIRKVSPEATKNPNPQANDVVTPQI